MLVQEREKEEEYQHQQQQMMMMMKGKRTKRARTASPFALAISNSGDEICKVATSSSTTTTVNESWPSSSQPHPPSPAVTEEEEDMANCLILLAQGASKTQKLKHDESESPVAVSVARVVANPGTFVYECKTCNRCFPSFQALGGHRASHRKPKLPTTILSLSEDHRDFFQSSEPGKIKKVEELGLSLQMACNSSNTLSASNINHENNTNNNNNNHKSNKVHTCAICGAEFASGQALGGHMRRHRPIATSGGPPATVKPNSPPSPAKNVLCLDLNLPADEQEEQQSPKFIFTSTEKTLVFANSLIDCRY